MYSSDSLPTSQNLRSYALNAFRASQGASDCCKPFKKGTVPRRIGRTKGGLNSKLHAVCDGEGRPVVLMLSEGQMSDYKGAALILSALPEAKELLGDRGYDADWFRKASRRARHHSLHSWSIKSQDADRLRSHPLPSTTKNRKHVRAPEKPARAKAGDWRRIHTRYDRCAHTSMSAICIAANVMPSNA